MELTPKQQATELIKKSNKILLLTPNADGDSIGAMVAIFQVAKKLNKEVVMVCPDTIPSTYSFLSPVSEIKKDLADIRNFVISLDCSKSPVSKLGYKMEGDKLNIGFHLQKMTLSMSLEG